MRIHFISIVTLTNIPSFRFVADFFIKKYKTKILITERRIKNENNYFVNDKIIFDYIDEKDSLQEILNQSLYGKLKKYLFLVFRLKIDMKNRKRTFLITPDYQVLFLIFTLKKLLTDKIKIIYLQYELVEPQGFLNNYMYKQVLKNANLINLAIFPEVNRALYFTQGCILKPKNRFILPNSCYPIKQTNIQKHYILKSIPQDALIIGHIGNVGEDNHFFHEFITAANKLSSKNIYFIFIGNNSNKLEKKIKSLTNKKILFFNKIPHQELKNIYPFFNLGLILYKGTSPNYEFAAPNKLYEYWAFGIPVIAHKLQGLTNIFSIPEQGKLINMNKTNEIQEAILNFKKIDKNVLLSYFNNILSISNYLKELYEILDNI